MRGNIPLSLFSLQSRKENTPYDTKMNHFFIYWKQIMTKLNFTFTGMTIINTINLQNLLLIHKNNNRNVTLFLLLFATFVFL